MQIAGRKFLVIGGAGFIGSHLVDQLLVRDAASVLVYDNFSRGSRANLTTALRDRRTGIFADGGDIQHLDMLKRAMEGVDGVFHLAALWLLQCYEYPRSAFDVNVTGTMNVIEAAIDCGVERMVFSSSASVYGDAVTEPMPEDHPLGCEEFYGASKVCGEMLVRAMCNRQRLLGHDMDFIGLRYMNVYGPRQYDDGDYISVTARMINALKRNEAPEVHGDGSQAFDFVDVRDCARANILAMESDASNAFFNVGTGLKTSVADLATRLIALWGSDMQVRHVDSDRHTVRNRIGSTSLAGSQLGFASEIDLDRGLADLVAWHHSATQGVGS